MHKRRGQLQRRHSARTLVFFIITQHNADAERAVADAESAVEAEPGAAISDVDTSGVDSFRDVWAQCTAVQHE